MDWKAISLKDRDWITEKFRQENRRECSSTFGNNYIWRSIYQVETAEAADCLLLRYQGERDRLYMLPIGDGDKKRAVELLKREAKAGGYPLRLCNVLKGDKAMLEDCFPGQYTLVLDRDSFDYIYTVEKLTRLSGRRLHAKRNHIARFKEQNEWHYEPMTSDNKEDCLAMAYQWRKQKGSGWSREMEAELCALGEAVADFEELRLEGGVLYAEGRAVAFTIGEPLCEDTYVVHMEKAYAGIQGAYPMINQQFVLNTCRNYTYVNREDDAGVEGLRRAKRSYCPDILLEKYVAEFRE